MNDYEFLTREVELKDRTPVTQATEIIMILDGCWLTDFNGDMSHKQILSGLLEAENVDATAMKEDLLSEDYFSRNPDLNDPKTRYLGFVGIIMAYCVQAIREFMANDEIPTNLAWTYVCQAERELSSLEIFRQVQLKLKEYVKEKSASSSENYVDIVNLVKTDIAKKKLEDFKPVREKGAKANKTKAKTNKAFILSTNSDLLKHADWARKTLDERAKYIVAQCVTQQKKMTNGRNYSESYIKKLITGA